MVWGVELGDRRNNYSVDYHVARKTWTMMIYSVNVIAQQLGCKTQYPLLYCYSYH